jgi:GR25 family glycosyltransferase involved in LPS biosynthesis
MIYGPYYINLDKRIDRKELIEKEFERLGFQATRFSAIEHEDGATGCLESHLALLLFTSLESMSNNITFICEDDIQFIEERDTLDFFINEFIHSDADILCLGNLSRNQEYYSSYLYRSYDLQTTSCYLIKDSFKSKLIELWSSVLKCRYSNEQHPLEDTYNKLSNAVPGFFLIADQC